MKLLIVNQPLANRGDESAHRALLGDLRRRFPDSSIEVFLINKTEADTALFRVEGVTYTHMTMKRHFHKFTSGLMRKGMPMASLVYPQARTIYAKMKNADWVICAPGGMDMGGFRDWLHLYIMRMAVAANRNVAYIGRSIGPFSDDDFSAISAKVLKSFRFLSLRDKESYDCAAALGANPVKTLDSAFLCRPALANPYASHGRKYGVFVPNSLNWHVNFKTLTDSEVISFWRGLLLAIRAQYPDHTMIMLPQLCGSGNDAPFFRKIAGDLPDVIVEDNTISSDIQQAVIRDASFVVGARYHSVVFSINNGTPFAALSYEHKIKGLLATLGLDDRMVPLSKDDLTAATIDRVLQVLATPCPDKSGEAAEIARKGINAFYELV